MMNKHQKERLEAALDYAQRGWRVLPVGLNKKPINHNGSIGATTDAKQILAWWTEHPFSNIGIACGPESFWVVDVDMKDGVDGLKSLHEEFGDAFASFNPEQSLWQQTPTSGLHILFKWPKKGIIHNAQGILSGVDIRGQNGYIVVAPSARKIGDKYIQYRWNNLALPIADATDWAKTLAERQLVKRAQAVDVEKVMIGLSSGERDTELWRYACHLKARGVPYDIALAFISVAAERCTPPFSASDAKEKVERAYTTNAISSSVKESRHSFINKLVRESSND